MRAYYPGLHSKLPIASHIDTAHPNMHAHTQDGQHGSHTIHWARREKCCFMGQVQTSRALYFWFTVALWPDYDVLQRHSVLHCDEYCWVQDQINSKDTLGCATCQVLSLEGCQGETKPLFIEIPGFFFPLSPPYPFFLKAMSQIMVLYESRNL